MSARIPKSIYSRVSPKIQQHFSIILLELVLRGEGYSREAYRTTGKEILTAQPAIISKLR